MAINGWEKAGDGYWRNVATGEVRKGILAEDGSYVNPSFYTGKTTTMPSSTKKAGKSNGRRADALARIVDGLTGAYADFVRAQIPQAATVQAAPYVGPNTPKPPGAEPIPIAGMENQSNPLIGPTGQFIVPTADYMTPGANIWARANPPTIADPGFAAPAPMGPGWVNYEDGSQVSGDPGFAAPAMPPGVFAAPTPPMNPVLSTLLRMYGGVLPPGVGM